MSFPLLQAALSRNFDSRPEVSVLDGTVGAYTNCTSGGLGRLYWRVSSKDGRRMITLDIDKETRKISGIEINLFDRPIGKSRVSEVEIQPGDLEIIADPKSTEGLSGRDIIDNAGEFALSLAGSKLCVMFRDERLSKVIGYGPLSFSTNEKDELIGVTIELTEGQKAEFLKGRSFQ